MFPALRFRQAEQRIEQRVGLGSLFSDSMGPL